MGKRNMLGFVEDQEYNELIVSLRDFTLKMNKEESRESKYNELLDQMNRILNEHNTLNYALDQSIIVAVTNKSGQILYVNDKFCALSKYSREELIGKTHRVINSGFHDLAYIKDMWDTITGGSIWEGEVKNKAKDGSYYWVKTTIVPFSHENHKPYMYIALRTDITASKENEERLVNALKNDFNMVVSSMHNFVFKVTKTSSNQFVYQFGEGRLAHELGLNTAALYQKEPSKVFPKELALILEEQYTKAFAGQTVTYNYSFRNYHLLTSLSPIYENGEIVNIIGCTNDISELNKTKEAVEYLAYHDTLTNLPNRRKFTEDITSFIEMGQKFGFFMLDFDRFKHINDSLGHTYGDKLLQVITERIQKILGSDGYFYRFAGDEFIILLPHRIDEETLNQFAQKLLSVFNDKVQLSPTIELYTTGSMGVTIFPDQGQDVDQLIKNADAAMYEAKRQGRNSFKVYDQAMRKATQEYLQIETFLQTAIENDEFELFFQPKFDIKANKINSMEALLRWNHPILGNVPPNTFIPIAEETGSIWCIDKWVLKNACTQNKFWNEAKMDDPLRVAVNISSIQFSHPDFVGMVKKVLEDTGLHPSLLELEITETALIKNANECINNIEKLRDIGIVISIDDFGTGYTSLNYLKSFSFDYLKIDQTFVREILVSKENMAIVKAIIALAGDLQLKVIAEGVEDQEILEYLKEIGCDGIQGYFISRPLCQSDFEKMLLTTNRQFSF